MGNTNVKPHPKPRSKKQVRWKAADRPAPPGKPSLVEENGTVPDVIHICWTKPVKDGGSTVTSYLVEHRRVGTGHWQPSSAQPTLRNELPISGLEPGWRYQFRVRAQNAVGLSDTSEISEPFTVTLQRSAIAAPKFTQELQDFVALENDKVEFEIHFLGQPPPNICWFKDGFEIFSGNRTRITTTADKSILTILQAAVSDEGEVKCTATNRAGHTVTKCRLTIEAPPSIKLPKAYQDPDGIIFEIGETIKMNVTVTGKPTPLIFWSHDGESIQNNDRYETEYIEKTASVKIENALRSDRGEYRLKAVNKLGQDQATFLVTITDKPTPPGQAKVLLTSGRSVTLCWSTPKDDGGCRVGNYIIEYYRLGWDVWLKAATTRQQSTMLADLIEGSQYKFRVKAESPYGVSEPSEESEVVFIPDPKRGIQDPSDVKRVENDSRISLSNRRRANSTPRVSFILNQEVPVRPERKKTGKTPEASPRFRRKQFSFLSKDNIGSEPSLNRKFSITNSVSSSTNTTGSTWNKTLVLNSPENQPGRTTFIKVEKHKSPSPEIIVTDTDSTERQKEKRKSPSESPISSGKSSPDGSNSGRSMNSNRMNVEKPKNLMKQGLEIKNKLIHEIPKNSEMSSTLNFNFSEKSPSRSPVPTEPSPPRSPISRIPILQGSSLPRSPSPSEKSTSRSPEIKNRSESGSPNHIETSPPRNLKNFKKSPSRSPESFRGSPFIFPEKKPSRSSREAPMFPNSNTSGNMNSSETTAESSKKNFEIHSENPVSSTISSDQNLLESRLGMAKASGMRKNDEKSFDKGINKFNANDNFKSPNSDRMRPPLTHQAFSGSSEFMLVLCPEGEEGTRFKKFGISFDENSIPPPLSLSAPELGTEIPEQISLKRWSSSTELLNYRLMERLQEATINESSVRETNEKLVYSNIPKIQVNSKPAAEIHSEERPTLNRRLSGILPHTHSSWSTRRHSLRNTDVSGPKLQKFEQTEQIRREILDYRRISESEHDNIEETSPKNFIDDEEWMRDYEESIPSDNESELSSPDERRYSKEINTRTYIEDDEEEIYNPRDRMISAVKVNDNKPFEILTVRKNPPNSNIIPKPILKKNFPNSNQEKEMRKTAVFDTNVHNENEDSHRRYRSNSLNGTTEDEIDVNQIKTSPTPGKRRSFSLMPSQANFITESIKAKIRKGNSASFSEKVESGTKNVSALANFTRIAGAGLIIPNEMQEKKETEEEAKVVVDFYGDIVKSFGGKSKPIAEFSTSVVSKYDTFEERKLAEIKPNVDTMASINKPTSPKNYDTVSMMQSKNYHETSDPQVPEASRISSNIQLIKSPSKMNEAILALDEKPKSKFLVQNNNTEYKEEELYKNKNSQETDETLRQLKSRLAKESLIYQKDWTTPENNMGKSFLNKRRSGRPGSRQSSVNRTRRKTPISRDASTSPVRFSDDWDSQCSSKTSLEQDYYNRGSVNSSRASSLSRRSLSPPRPKLRGITTQTSFRNEPFSPLETEEKIHLAKKAEERMSFVFGYLTDAAMVGVATWLYLFQNEFLAIPFIVIPVYRQLDNKVKALNQGIKRRLPKWITRRFEKNS